MFIGAINQPLRQVLKEMAQSWPPSTPVYVGCSGNFTVERLLSQEGIQHVISNDISMYSCAIGQLLTGQRFEIGIKRQDMEWLTEYLASGEATVATLLLCSEYLNFIDRDTPYHRRMSRHYEANFANLHAKTMERVSRALDGVRIDCFYPLDVADFAEQIVPDTGAVFITFPPTYKGGYERLYKKIDEIFDWQPPTYHVFDSEAFERLTDIMTRKERWVTMRDEPIIDLQDSLKAVLQTSLHSKSVYVYAGEGTSRVVLPRQKIGALNIERLEGEVQWPITFQKITQDQMNLLRSEYLSKSILPASSDINLALLSGGRLFGAVAFSRGRYERNRVYMMTDFAIQPTVQKRLSKLVLAVALSSELRTYLECKMNMRITKVITTAFTDKPVSMKYRGLFEILNRKEGMINYQADAGKWTLREAFEWWNSKHSTK